MSIENSLLHIDDKLPPEIGRIVERTSTIDSHDSSGGVLLVKSDGKDKIVASVAVGKSTVSNRFADIRNIEIFDQQITTDELIELLRKALKRSGLLTMYDFVRTPDSVMNELVDDEQEIPDEVLRRIQGLLGAFFVDPYISDSEAKSVLERISN